MTQVARIVPLNPAPQPAPRARSYNTGRRSELSNYLHREEARREFDLALADGDAELARWARAWGEAIRSDLRRRAGPDAY